MQVVWDEQKPHDSPSNGPNCGEGMSRDVGGSRWAAVLELAITEEEGGVAGVVGYVVDGEEAVDEEGGKGKLETDE